MIVPEYEVAALGVNVTVTVWLPPAETERLVGLTVKALLLLDMLEIVSVALPVLLIVKPCWLEAPTVTLPNGTDVAERLITGVAVATPVPVTLTVVGLPEALWLIVIVPEYVPITLGVNVTVTV